MESGDDALRRNGRYSVMNFKAIGSRYYLRSEEHTSELQSRRNLVCRLLLEKKKHKKKKNTTHHAELITYRILSHILTH